MIYIKKEQTLQTYDIGTLSRYYQCLYNFVNLISNMKITMMLLCIFYSSFCLMLIFVFTIPLIFPWKSVGPSCSSWENHLGEKLKYQGCKEIKLQAWEVYLRMYERNRKTWKKENWEHKQQNSIVEKKIIINVMDKNRCNLYIYPFFLVEESWQQSSHASTKSSRLKNSRSVSTISAWSFIQWWCS